MAALLVVNWSWTVEKPCVDRNLSSGEVQDSGKAVFHHTSDDKSACTFDNGSLIHRFVFLTAA